MSILNVKGLFCSHVNQVVIGNKLCAGSALHVGKMKVYYECNDCGKLYSKVVKVEQLGISVEQGRLSIYLSDAVKYQGDVMLENPLSVDDVFVHGIVEYKTLIRMLSDMVIRMSNRLNTLTVELKGYKRPAKSSDIEICKEISNIIHELRNTNFDNLMSLGEDKLVVDAATGAAINKVFNKVMKYKYYDNVQFIEKLGKIVYSKRKNRKK